MKSIRWGGLIAIIVIMSSLAVALLFAGSIVKPFMESSFTAMNGARVDIGDVNISYTPLTMEINNIQIADPTQAMVNTAQIDKVKFAISLGYMLLGKVVIDEASITGIQIDTPRRKSGLITRASKQEEKEDQAESIIPMPEIDLPDVKEILAAEPLLSDKLMSALEEDFSKTEVQWQEISNALPDKAKSDEYEARYKKIQSDAKGDFKQKLAAVKDAKQLSEDLKAEAQRIKQAKQQFSTDLDRIGEEIKAVKNAPAKDIARIKDKYRLDNLNAENISEMLFGEKVAGYVALAKQWYRRIEPYLPEEDAAEEPKVERSQGVDVVFKESDPKPDVFVGVAAMTANLPRGQFEGSVTAISSDQSINRQPMRLKLRGVALSNKESEEISGEFNYIDKKNGYSRFNYAVAKSQITDFVVSRSSKLPLTMKQAVMDLKLDVRLQHGSLKGTAKTQFNKVSFDSGDSSSLLSSSFKGVEAFKIDGQFSGAIGDLSIRIDSDLDNQLGQQLKNQLNQKKQAFENELRASLDAKLKEPMSKIEAKKAKLDAIKNKIDQAEAQLQERLAALKETISREEELKKNEVTDKLKDKLKGKFGL